MTESAFQADVLELAAMAGVMGHHCTDSRRCAGPRGFPDTWLAGPRGLLVAELKDYGGTLKPGQVQWKYSLLAAGIQWRLWRPADLRSGLIETELRSIA